MLSVIIKKAALCQLNLNIYSSDLIHIQGEAILSQLFVSFTNESDVQKSNQEIIKVISLVKKGG